MLPGLDMRASCARGCGHDSMQANSQNRQLDCRPVWEWSYPGLRGLVAAFCFDFVCASFSTGIVEQELIGEIEVCCLIAISASVWKHSAEIVFDFIRILHK